MIKGSCKKSCGKCCEAFLAYLKIIEPEVAKKKYPGVPLDGSCYDPKTKKCLLQDNKPKVCAEWPTKESQLTAFPECGYYVEVSDVS